MPQPIIPTPVQELTPKVHAAVLAGIGDRAPSIMQIPNARYTDSAIAEAELRTTFSAPLLVAPGSVVAGPEDYRTMGLMGTPVVLIRGADGRARVFVNACRHRGARVMEESGCSRRFTCPYHSWVYDTQGDLVGIPGREGFDGLDVESHGLVELPSEERHGFIWALRDPDGALDLDAHLGPLDAELAAWGYDYEVAATTELELRSNWKCALEAFQETYHFPTVHANSIVGHGSVANIVTFDQFGRHHRLGVPHVAMGSGPEPAPGENLSAIYYIYPCTAFASSPFGGELLQFFPGPTSATSTVRHLVLSRFPLADERIASIFEEYTPKIQLAVLDEDVPVLEGSGQGLATGFIDTVLGRNEIGCQAAHRQLLADLARDEGARNQDAGVALSPGVAN